MKSAFAKKLSRLRREAGYSQRQAASNLGISQALLSHYENGAREPKLEFVIRACDFYSVSADHLLGRIDEKTRPTLPSPHGCEGAPRLISTACAVFDALEELSDEDLYAAAVDYLVIPIETVAAQLSDPDTQYDPVRDAKLKMAEAAFMTSVRSLRLGEN